MSATIAVQPEISTGTTTNTDKAQEILKGILGAEDAVTKAIANFETQLIEGTPMLWALSSEVSVKAMAQGIINPKTGKAVSTDTIKSYLRVGRVIERTTEAKGATARDLLKAVNDMFNAPGSFGKNDAILDEYLLNEDKPTWKGFINAVNKALRPASEAVSDDDKQATKVKGVAAFMKGKNRKFTAEQWATLSAFAPK